MNQSDTMAAKFPWAAPGAEVAVLASGRDAVIRTTVSKVTATRIVTAAGYVFFSPKYGRSLEELGNRYAHTLVPINDPAVAVRERRFRLVQSTRAARDAALEFQKGDAAELETARLIKVLVGHMEEIEAYQNGN